MFERFTDRARRVVVLAQEEARTLNHNYIGTEHIMLGLIREGEGVAATGLKNLDISLEAEREFGTFDEIVVLLRDIARRVKRIEQRLARDDDAGDDEAHGHG